MLYSFALSLTLTAHSAQYNAKCDHAASVMGIIEEWWTFGVCTGSPPIAINLQLCLAMIDIKSSRHSQLCILYLVHMKMAKTWPQNLNFFPED